MVVWWFVFRAMLASAYITLGLANPELAGKLAWPFGVFVFCVAVNDLLRFRHGE